MARYLTAATIVNRVAVEVGLTEVPAPFSSSDPAFKQLVKLLTSVGQELLGKRTWPHLIASGSIATTGAPNHYDVPTDFLKFIDRTLWDTQNDAPASGSLSPTMWALVVNEPVFSTVYIHYREVQDQFWLFPTDTPAGLTLPYEYQRRTWAKDAGSNPIDEVSAPDDTILFEPIVVIKLLKLRFLGARGFSTMEAEAQYREVYENYSGNASSAPVLSLTGGLGSHLLDTGNAPDTGFG